MKLLNIDANAKTVKGQKRGYLTAVMYLAPYTHSGRNVCPFADVAKCWEGCLNTAGRGGIAKRGATIATDAGTLPDNAIQRARLARTALYWDDRPDFMRQLVCEIESFLKKADKLGLIPCVRLNGTSDIDWMREACTRLDPAARRLIKRTPGASLKREGRTLEIAHANIFEAFPDLQFYDYTKVYKRFRTARPDNYHLCLSYSEANADYARKCRQAHEHHSAPLVIVMRDKATKARAMISAADSCTVLGQSDRPIVDGDENDLRFRDPAGALIYLYAKGSARRDTSGFVIG